MSSQAPPNNSNQEWPFDQLFDYQSYYDSQEYSTSAQQPTGQASLRAAALPLGAPRAPPTGLVPPDYVPWGQQHLDPSRAGQRATHTHRLSRHQSQKASRRDSPPLQTQNKTSQGGLIPPTQVQNADDDSIHGSQISPPTLDHFGPVPPLHVPPHPQLEDSLGEHDSQGRRVRPRLEAQKLGADDTRRSRLGSNAGSHEDPPNRKPHWLTIIACDFWKCRNEGSKPRLSTADFLGELCKESPQVISSWLDQDTGPCAHCTRGSMQVDQSSPHHHTVAACEIWKFQNPGQAPTPRVITMLQALFHDPDDVISNWSRRNAFNDSAIEITTGSKQSVLDEAAERLCCNRKHCLRNAKLVAKAAARLREGPKKTPSKPFLCVLCGRTFPTKENWKRHEMNNRLQELWLCGLSPCCREPLNPKSSRVWSRKQELVTHTRSKHHGAPIDFNEWFVKVQPNFRANCIFSNCDESIRSFAHYIDHISHHFEDHDWEISQLRNVEDEKDGYTANKTADRSDSHSSSDDGDGSDSGGDDAFPPDAGHGATGHGGLGPQNPGPGTSGTSGTYQHTSRGNMPHNTGYELSSATNYALGVSRSMLYQFIRGSAEAAFSDASLLLDDFMEMVAPGVAILGRLGTGGTSIIVEVRVPGRPKTVACKTFQCRPKDLQGDQLREQENLSRLSHPHIVKVIAGYRQANTAAILMHPVADYNLSQYLATCSSAVDEKRNIWLWFSCLSSGLQHMHQMGIQHQDIKPSNILVKNQNVLFADFGSSVAIQQDSYMSSHAFEFTRLYAAPEVFTGERKTSSDVFSLGCVFLEMVTRLLSKDHWQQLRLLQQQSYQAKQNPLHWTCVWADTLLEITDRPMTEVNVKLLLRIVKTMTDPVPEHRPTAAEVEEKLSLRLRPQCSYSSAFSASKKSLTWPLDNSARQQFCARRYRQEHGSSPRQHWHSLPADHSISTEVSTSISSFSGLSSSTKDDGNTLSPDCRKEVLWEFLKDKNAYEHFRVLGRSTQHIKITSSEDKMAPYSKTSLRYELELTLDSTFVCPQAPAANKLMENDSISFMHLYGVGF